jgi:hypothetical protein
MLAVGTPRRAVVHQHLGGQAVVAEGGGQPAPFFQGAAVCPDAVAPRTTAEVRMNR